MVIKRLLVAVVGVFGLMTTACSSMPFDIGQPFGGDAMASDATGTDLTADQLERELAEERRRNASLAAEVARLTGDGDAADRVQTASLAGGALASDEYPSDARPGQCFARVRVPEVTRVVTESVTAEPEREQIKVIPAQFEMIEEQVLVREEAIEYDIIPAQYQTVSEQVLVEDEKIESVVIPAQFETVEERILVRDEYETWKPGAGLFGRGEGAGGDGAVSPTGEILCRVLVPAQYRTVTRRVMVQPERTEERVIPARFDTVQKRVVVEPPQVVERVVPAQFNTVRVRRMVEPPREERIVVPASQRMVERTQLVSPERLAWTEVLCDTNATAAKIASVQRALTEAGYAPGPADGVFGRRTLRAMEAFQRDNGLMVGALTRETVEALDVPFAPSIDA